MRSILPVLLLGMVQAAIAGCGADVREQAAPGKKELLDRLLVDYRKYELPLPPETAPLVRVEYGYVTSENESRRPLIALGFLTKAAHAGSRAEILIGTALRQGWESPPFKQSFVEVKPEPGIEKDIQVASYGMFQTNACLATALQCHARGWSRLAETLFDLSMNEPFSHQIEREDYDRKGTQGAEVAFLAWAQRANELFLPGTDRSVSLRRLKVLIAAEPRLEVKINRDLIASLEAALVPGKGEPGSIESLIDGLVELCSCDLDGDPLPQALALIDRGFDAVPGLLAHCSDQRLTRFDSTQAGSHFPCYPWIVGGVCAWLLRGLVGYETANTWDANQPDVPEWKSRVQAWFEKAGEKGEEAWLRANALPAGEWPNRHILRVLSRKYPEDLGPLYRELLEKHPGMQSWPLADQIVRSGLPRTRKVELLKIGAQHQNLDHRYAALWSLQDLDPETGGTLLVESLHQLPPTCPGKYSNSREASFGLLVRRTADPRAWTALAGAARRADVGLRLVG